MGRHESPINEGITVRFVWCHCHASPVKSLRYLGTLHVRVLTTIVADEELNGVPALHGGASVGRHSNPGVSMAA